MNEITLAAETGRPLGSRPAGRLRADGKVPGVLYGKGTEPTPLVVDWRELRHALTTEAGLNAVINLEVGGETKLTIVKEMQRHPVKRNVLHVDFIVIDRDKPIEVEVPIHLHGEAKEVLDAQGVVDQTMHTLTVLAKPGAIPNELTVDISGLTLDAPIRVSDIALPDGVITELDPEEVVVSGQITRAAIEDEEVAEGEEGAEGETAEGDAGEGDQPGGGDDAGEPAGDDASE
jgi:large subunit ribosomal protein L25